MNTSRTFCNDLAELPGLVTFAADFADRVGLPRPELSRLLLILDELFSNIVRHGYDTPDARGAITIGLSFEAGRLGIEITDDGRAFDPLALPPPDLDLTVEDRPVGGLGIHFVRQMTDDAWYTRSEDRNCLSLIRGIVPEARSGGATQGGGSG